LIGEYECEVLIALGELGQQVESSLAAFGSENALAGGVVVAQIAFDGAQYSGIVVNGQ